MLAGGGGGRWGGGRGTAEHWNSGSRMNECVCENECVCV